MVMSSTSKTGLAFGAVLPVLASLYGELQQRSQLQEQQSLVRNDLLKHARSEAVTRDLETAKVLLNQIAVTTGDASCEHFYVASELVRLGGYYKASRRALISALRYQSEAALQPRICDCQRTLNQMRSSWRPTLNNTTSPAVIDEMNQVLDAAYALCGAQETEPMLAASPAAMPAVEDAGVAPATSPAVVAHDEPTDDCSKSATATTLAVRVYLQIADESQRQSAERLAVSLTGLGYTVPGIERVASANAPSSPQLRFVYDEDAAEAERLRAVLSACKQPFTLQPAMTQYRRHAARYSFEIWFPRMSAQTGATR
jgi:hypothetical protein